MLKSGKDKTEFYFDTGTLRFKITAVLLAFVLIIFSMLLVAQSFSLSGYYRYEMKNRTDEAVDLLAQVYSSDQTLDFDSFGKRLSDLTSNLDIYFFIETTNGDYSIASTDITESGRRFSDTINMINTARANLAAAKGDEISYTAAEGTDHETYVSAKTVGSSFRQSINIYAIANITPIGPAVDIIRSQLFLVTIAAIFLSGYVALTVSRGLSRPIIQLNEKAKLLGRKQYDVDFTTKGFTEIEELSNTLNNAAAELAKADGLQKDLIANVSHDLRTPLTMIKSYAEMIKDISGDDPVRREQHLDVIISETDRLSDLVGDMLMVSKLQAGTLEMTQSTFDIQKTVESILSTFMVMEQEGYHFTFTRVPGEIKVTGDQRRLQQVISNLISNAIRYSKEGGGNIDVALIRRSENTVVFSVTDNGIGIDKDDLDKIWNRYQKASKQGKRPVAGSTGLGLSIVREILEYHHAVYGVESTPGVGSTFWFEIACEYN